MHKNRNRKTDEANDKLCRNTTQQRHNSRDDTNEKKSFGESKEDQKSNPFERR